METKTYPRINVVFSNERERSRFLKKARRTGKPASWVFRQLADLWVKGEINLTT